MSSRSDQPLIADAAPHQWRETTAALAAAFGEDPVLAWLLPDPASRPTALARFFAVETRDLVLAHGRSVLAARDADTLGAALVLPPGHWRMPLRLQARHAPTYTRIFGRRLPHALGVITAMERRHPRRAHVYLPYIGVVPAAQGRGLGTAVLAPVLDRCDRERVPAYLEASSPRNARLYARLGFVAVEEIRPLGSPPLALMWREPA